MDPVVGLVRLVGQLHALFLELLVPKLTLALALVPVQLLSLL